MIGIVNKVSETGKTALLLIKEHAMAVGSTPVYVTNANYKVGQEVTIPSELKIVDWKQVENKLGQLIMLKTLGLR